MFALCTFLLVFDILYVQKLTLRPISGLVFKPKSGRMPSLENCLGYRTGFPLHWYGMLTGNNLNKIDGLDEINCPPASMC